VARRRAIDAAYVERGEGEARADVARRQAGAHDGARGPEGLEEVEAPAWTDEGWDEDDPDRPS
jgi:hypothetical protein